MANASRGTKETVASHKISDAAKRATSSPTSAQSFLKSAGILTSKGNLSPKYR